MIYNNSSYQQQIISRNSAEEQWKVCVFDFWSHSRRWRRIISSVSKKAAIFLHDGHVPVNRERRASGIMIVYYEEKDAARPARMGPESDNTNLSGAEKNKMSKSNQNINKKRWVCCVSTVNPDEWKRDE